MRTTLTLEADVARLLEEEVHRRRRPMKVVVNELLRDGLSHRRPSEPRPRFKVQTSDSPLLPGIDARSLNQLADELEDQAILRKLATPSAQRRKRRRARTGG